MYIPITLHLEGDNCVKQADSTNHNSGSLLQQLSPCLYNSQMGVSHKVHSALTLSLSPLSPSLSSVSVSAPAHSDRPGYPGPGGPGLLSPGLPGPGKLLWAESRRQQQPGERRPWDAGDGAAASGDIEHQSQQLRQLSQLASYKLSAAMCISCGW